MTDELLLSFDEPALQRVGVPGAGGVMRAADLALFYQAVLHNPGEMWRPDVHRDATTNVGNSLPERVTGLAANRTLGLIQAGDDGERRIHAAAQDAVGMSAFGDIHGKAVGETLQHRRG